MRQDAKNLMKPMFVLFFWSMDPAFHAGVGGSSGPRLKLASRVFLNFIERRIIYLVLSTPVTHQGGLADLEAAAAAADPLARLFIWWLMGVGQ